MAALLALLVSFGAASAASGAPLGDGRVVTKAPRAGFFFACKPQGSPLHGARPWIGRRAFSPDARPVTPGSVTWPNARFEVSRNGPAVSLSGNGLPVETPTGAFPAARGSAAAAYPEAGGSIAPHAVSGSIAERARAGKTRCVPPGLIGVASNGIPLLPPADSDERDLVAREVTDACGGSVTESGLYHYRSEPGCLPGGGGHGSPLGIAIDGFAIYGSSSAGRGPKLDRCRGHRHRVSLPDGGSGRRYHRHASARFPYLIGCLRAKPGGVATSSSVAAATSSFRATPALYPAFDPSISDYVTRCKGAPVSLDISTAPDETASVDGGQRRSGSFGESVPLGGGQALTVRFEGPDGARTHHVRCLPGDFPDWKFVRASTPSLEYVLVTPWLGLPNPQPYVMAFDRNGVPIWFYRASALPLDAKLLENGSLAFARYKGGGFATDESTGYEIRRLDGSLIREVKTVGSPTDHHDLIEVGNGNLLALTYRARDGADLSPYGGPASATILDSEIQEIAPNGSVVWSWSSKDHIALGETGRWWPTIVGGPATLPDGRAAYDATHINSIELDGDQIVLSLRHTDAVYAIDRATGDVEWKLGGTATPERLTVAGDFYGGYPLGGQHDARILPDGSVTVHDNATMLGGGRLPRGVRFAIDETAGTATFVEALNDQFVPSSNCCGSARKLPAGTWLMGWGGNTIITELTTNRRPWALTFGGGSTYRAFPVEPGRLSAASLRQGMDAMYPRG